jgi:hypothetical protein
MPDPDGGHERSSPVNATLFDLAERVGWTFVQAAGGTAVTLQTFDWRAALAGGGVAALLALLKVVGVNAASSNRTKLIADVEADARAAVPGLIDDLEDLLRGHISAVQAATAPAVSSVTSPADAESTAEIPAVPTGS